MLEKPDIDRRLLVWCALSRLFLDTDLQPQDYASIAARLRDSGYSPDALYRILRDEVAPAFAPNLASVAGAWAGWSEDTVRFIMLRSLRSDDRPLARLWRWWRTPRRHVDCEWNKLAPHLLA
jgi:hypothetical protein